jgi:UDPglucose 6-dehydrogenase
VSSTTNISILFGDTFEMRIAIVGSGYVGLVAAACFAEIGHQVVCVDNDETKVAALQRGETIIHEEFLPELLARHSGGRLQFTTSLSEGLKDAAMVFIAVGTPPCENGEADVSVLDSVCREIARSVDGFKVVVIKSTVPVGTNQWIARLLRRHGAHPSCFRVASNPEFLREGTAVTDFLYPDRIVLGCNCSRSADLLTKAYEPLLDGSYAASSGAIPAPDNARIPARVVASSSASAELIKHASNAYLAMKISFINAVANICEANGADIEEVVEGIGSDRRIGSRFLKPGIGYGGSCFPKDLRALRAVAHESGCDFRLLEEVMRINENQRAHFVRKVRQALQTLKGKRLGVLGLAFKGGTDDVRESPAIAVIHRLLQEGCRITAYDPVAAARARTEFSEGAQITFARSAYAAAADADALLVLTEWEEFAALDLARLRTRMKQPILLDGRNLFAPEQVKEAGFIYYSVGRPEEIPELEPKDSSREAA